MSVPSTATWTVRDCIAWTVTHFAAKEVPNPRVDAEELLAHAFELPRLQLLLKMDQVVPPPVREKFRGYIQRRAQREPLQHILGCVDFFGFRIDTAPGVLIPRPETEGLVERAVTFLRERRPVSKPPLPVLKDDSANAAPVMPAAVAATGHDPQSHGGSAPAAADSELRVWDIGTGSGCIAIAIAKMHPYTQILATDLAPAALDLARKNADRHGLKNRVHFRKADLDQGLTFTAPFDLIVANPPYIAAGLKAGIQPEVTHDPDLALYAGPDGLDCLRRILAMAPRYLRSNGRLMLEIGHDQGPVLQAEAAQLKFNNIMIEKDLQNLDRYFLARPPVS